MYRYFAILSCLLFASSSLLGQAKYTVSGYITDAQTGETLIGANVFETKNSAGTVSNLYGFYSMTLPMDSIYLTFSYIGFQSQTIGILLDKDYEFNILLSESVELDVVEITAKSVERIEDKTQMSVIDIPIDQIQRLPALLGEVDVIKTLQLLPGVQSGGEGQSGLYVRGGSPDQNLVLLDGVPVYNVNHLFGFFSVFNSDAIKDVKLTKGGFPARYGGRLSSVLEINMKEGNSKEFHGVGSIGLISSKLSLEGPIIKDKASFIISGRRTYIDLLARPLISASLKQSGGEGKLGYYFYDLNAKVNYKISNNDRIYLSAYLGDDRFYVDTGTTEDDFKESIKTNLGWGNLTTALRWNHKWGNRMFSNLTGTFSRYNFNTLAGTTFEEYTSTGAIEEKENFEFSYDSGIDDISARIDFDFIPDPDHYIKYGAQIINHSFNPGLFNLFAESVSNGSTNFSLDTLFGQPKVNALEYNVFVEDDYKITSGLKVNGGLHFSGFNIGKVNYTSLQPRISLRQLLPNDIAIKASFATMRQYTQYLTNENIGLPWDQWLPTTETVKPQNSWQVALGAAKTIGNDYEFSIEAYYKGMENLISYKDGASLFSTQPWEDLVTQGNGRSYGTEFFVQKKNGRFTGWVGYTLAWSERQFADKNFNKWYPFKFDRRHDLSIVGLYELSDRINISSTWVYGTGNAVTFAESVVPTLAESWWSGENTVDFIDFFTERNNHRLEPYHRLDVNIDFIKKKKRHTRTWSFGAYNAYSRKNPFFVNLENDSVRDANGNTTQVKVLRQYSLFPIIPSVSYRFEF